MNVRLSFAFFIIVLQCRAASFLTVGYGHGGDFLADASGGQDYSTQAGTGLFFIGGLLVPISATVPHRFEGQLGVGYLFQNDERSKDDSVSWSRIPIEALYFYHHTRNKFRLGWGATYHVANNINGRGTNANAGTHADNAWGLVVAVEKLWCTETGETMAVGLRHTSINYRLTAFDKVVNGGAWSVTFTGLLF